MVIIVPHPFHLFVIAEVEDAIYRERVEQAVLENREEMLRYQLELLERERSDYSETWTEARGSQWSKARRELLELISDRQKSEEEIRKALDIIWESDIRARAVSGDASVPIRLSWPVSPENGISAHFDDKDYEYRFGFRHNAIDIPVLQGTEVKAAADGIVEVIFNGDNGYQYVILSHEGGATLYAHVETFAVGEGQAVKRGDVIAYSGGRPGTLGAGPISTGPHLHFELIRGGVKVDPLDFLPRI